MPVSFCPIFSWFSVPPSPATNSPHYVASNLSYPTKWQNFIYMCSSRPHTFSGSSLPNSIDQVINMVSAEFTEKANAVQSLTKRPSDDELLKLYGLYKQANVGDNETPKPGMFNLKDKYKWQSWADLKGTSQEEAEKLYIELADELLAKYQ